MFRDRCKAAVALLAMLASLCLLAPMQAQTQQVVASVNGEQITDSSVIQHIRLTELLAHRASTWQQALDEIIDGVLTLQTAAHRGVAPTDAEVATALDGMSRSLHSTTGQLEQTLAQEGISITALRLRVRFDLASQRIFAGARFGSLPASALQELREVRRGATIELKDH